MPRRRTKDQGGTENKQQLSREMRRKKLALFIQQFEKEAQDRLNDLESRMEDLLATTDKLFKVELMKMPPSLQNTLIRDLISGECGRFHCNIKISPYASLLSSANSMKKGHGMTSVSFSCRGSSVMTKRAQTRLTSRQTAEQAVQKQTTPKLRSVPLVSKADYENQI
uniref:Borealin N-terminal domain-containing protein n=1 Tax=Cyprinodon variegatus TaxID=28743 RepID=A0A3Q2GKR8_CYPVA